MLLMTNVKQFVGLHLFEFVYLCVLAILPFLVAKPVVGLSILVILAYLGLGSVWRKLTFKQVPQMEAKSVFITGCDTGFGHALAKRMSSMGLTVFAGCLYPEGDGAKNLKTSVTADKIRIISLDVSSEESVKRAVNTVRQNTKENGLWCLVNNAGTCGIADVEFCSMDMYKRVTEINLFGTIRVTKACLPLVRTCKGRIINVTSANVCYPCHSAHAMTKSACDAFSNCLRREVKKFGVRVVTVEPGNFYGATGLLSRSAVAALEKDFEKLWQDAEPEVKDVYGKDYLYAVHQSMSSLASTTCNTIGPVVDALEDAVVSTRPKSNYLVDGSSKPFDFHNLLLRLSWLLPQSLTDYIIDKEFCSDCSINTKAEKEYQDGCQMCNTDNTLTTCVSSLPWQPNIVHSQT